MKLRTQAYSELEKNISESLEDASVQVMNANNGITNAILLNIAGSMATIADVLATKKEEAKKQHGRWIIDKNGNIMCSKCEAVPSDWKSESVEACAFVNRFCRYCGADMRQKESDGE